MRARPASARAYLCFRSRWRRGRHGAGRHAIRSVGTARAAPGRGSDAPCKHGRTPGSDGRAKERHVTRGPPVGHAILPHKRVESERADAQVGAHDAEADGAALLLAPRAGRASARAVGTRGAARALLARPEPRRGARAPARPRRRRTIPPSRPPSRGRAAQRQQQCGAPRPPPTHPHRTHPRARQHQERRFRISRAPACVSTSELRVHFDLAVAASRRSIRTLLLNPNNKTHTRLYVRVSLQSGDTRLQ